MKIVTLLGVMALAPAILAAADAPYIGKWKLNPAKSQLTGETATIEKTSNGMMRFGAGDVSYTFNLDGKEYPTPDGGTTAWKATDANNWDVTNRVNGKTQMNYRLTTKGDTLTVQMTVHKPDGGTVEQSSVWTRVSGGPGPMGKWRSSEVKAAATVFEIAANGADGIAITDATFGFTCSAKFDGKEYRNTGPSAGGKSTFIFKTLGPRSFEMTQKTEGKAVYVDTYTVSADGKTLTDDGSPLSAKEPIKAVYDRQ